LPKKSKKYKAKKKEKPEISEQKENPPFAGKYAQSPRKERTPEQKLEYKKLALYLAGWFALVATVYYIFVQIGNETLMRAVMLSYLVLAAAFFTLWAFYNGGFAKTDVSASISNLEKPDDMGYDEFCAFIEKIKERRKKSKYFLIAFMPFIVVMLLDWWIAHLMR
jgi:hypothetical protein